jgi:hypothetical protein
MEEASGRPIVRRLAPALVLGAVIMVLVGGWLLFPYFATYVHRQDCVAAGRMNCGG